MVLLISQTGRSWVVWGPTLHHVCMVVTLQTYICQYSRHLPLSGQVRMVGTGHSLDGFSSPSTTYLLGECPNQITAPN